MIQGDKLDYIYKTIHFKLCRLLKDDFDPKCVTSEIYCELYISNLMQKGYCLKLFYKDKYKGKIVLTKRIVSRLFKKVSQQQASD